ncbi:MAG: hypothetical protein ACFFCW_36765 [Candidatus Hodarchaeota archaeon]
MPESPSHKKLKGKAPGKTEVPIGFGRRLDSATAKTATEIERNSSRITDAISRLKSSDRPRKVIQVPQGLMPQAVAEMRRQEVSGTVKNLTGTKRRFARQKS